MHVVYVIDSLVPGGAERSLVALAAPLAARGVQLEVAYLHDRAGLQADLEREGVTLHHVASRGRVDRVRSLRKLFRQLRPELVHTTLFESDVAGRVAARRVGVPVVSSLVSEHYGAAHLGNPLLQRWKVRGAQLVDASTARLAVRLHGVSAFVADEMSRRLGYPRDRIDIIPRGRDPRAFPTSTPSRRAAVRARLGISPATRVVLAVARQEHAKGLDTVIEAMSNLRRAIGDVQLLVAGQEGAATGDLQQRVARLGLGEVVTFLGGRDDVPDLLAAADVFVLASRREGSPGSVIEAMAVGVPVVVSDLPQVREIVDDASGRLVPPDSPTLLADAIAEVLAQPALAGQRARVARQRFLEHFTIDQVADGMAQFYARSLSKDPR